MGKTALRLGGVLAGALLWLAAGAVSAQQQNTLVPVYSLLLFDLNAGPSVELVRDINPGLADGEPEDLFAWNGQLFFEADDGVSGNEVWMSDGTEIGTTMLRDIHVGAGSSNGYGFIGWDRNFTAMNGLVYFAATSSDSPASLWQTDGTESGTTHVYAVSPSHMTVLNNVLYFNGYDGSDSELWRSDGTPGGTAMLKNISASGSSYPGEAGGSSPGFTLYNNELYFPVSNATPEVCGLWKTNGTSGGTVAVKPGTSLEPAGEIAVCGNFLYFPVSRYVTDHYEYDLWKSNGSAGGTSMIAGMPSFIASSPGRFTVYNGSLYFSANDGMHGWELWKLDCTTDVGTMVKDISTDPFGDSQEYLTVLNGFLYFKATDTVYGAELWRTDGTEGGTTLVKDINPGASGSAISGMTAYKSKLYFSATDGTQGDELWQSDGTAAGTTLLKDINPGPDWSYPYEFTAVNGSLFFTATEGATGWELWRLQP